MGGSDRIGSRTDIRGGRGGEGHAVELSPELTIDELVAVARHGAPVAALGGTARERVEASRATVVAALAEPDARIYGITTGYGSLAGTTVKPEDAATLSWNLVLKCAAGVGPPLADEWVRAMLLVRANSLARGASGVRPVIIDTLVEMLNRHVTPVVPSKGSLGASGDLAPLAHLAAVAAKAPAGYEGGDSSKSFSGEAWFAGRRSDGATAMARAGIPRPSVTAKEGLAFTNGTAMMVAGAALQLYDARRLLRHAELAAALSLEGLLARSAALDPALHEANNQPGQVGTAARLRALTAGSELIDSDPDRVQDAYSLRCTPQVIGPVHDMADFLWGRVEASLSGVSDNPLVFPSTAGAAGAVVSGGNFHGAGPALWLDTLGIAMTDVCSLSDRRVFRMLTPELSAGLPAMLVAEPGLNGGLMSVQYTGAALVSDNKTLAHPDSVDSIPTSANQEDHVSMGANAARHTREIVDNARTVIAIELLSAAQAVYLRPNGPERLGAGTRAVYDAVRARVAPVDADRSLSADIEAVEAAMDDGSIDGAAAAALGDLRS